MRSENPFRLSPAELARTTTPTTTVEVISTGTIPGFRVNGIEQRAGDRSRCPREDARRLERSGKARIVEGSEKSEWI